MTWPRAALLAAALFLARQVLVAGLTPALHAPDEQAHFDYAQRLAEQGALPACAPEELRIGAGAWSPEVRALLVGSVEPIAFHPERPLPPAVPLPAGAGARETRGCSYVTPYPPLYYAAAALGYRAALDGTLGQRLFAARLTGLAWGLLAVLSAFAVGLLLGGRPADGLLLALLTSLQPMAGFLFASVNSDGAAIACSSAAVACLAWLWRRPASLAPLAALAASGVAGALSKPTFALLLPWIALAALLVLGPRRSGTWLRGALALAPTAAAVLGWTWLMREAYLERAGGAEAALTLAAYLRDQLARPQRLFWVWVKLYWLGWGWVDVYLRNPAYLLLAAGLAAAAAGAIVRLRTGSVAERFALRVGAAATAGLVLTLYAMEYRLARRGLPDFVNGRYLLVLLVPHMLMLALGLRGLGERLRLRLDLAWAAVPCLVLLEAAAALRCVARYAPPGASRLAHAREVFEAFAPGWFWPALALHALALAGVLAVAALALAGRLAPRQTSEVRGAPSSC